MKKIAVVLCGSGFKDGSEVRESVGVLWALSFHPVQVQCFAPTEDQADVVDCYSGQVIPEQKRSMLVESARIARGKILPLEQLDPNGYDGIVIPGGYGVAKNLCDFASKGSRGTVHVKLAEILKTMHEHRKPIGAVCIAPAVIALTFQGKKLELTVGAAGEASQELERLGHRHVVKKASECHIDISNRIITSPAYMYEEAPLKEIFKGIQSLVNEVINLS